jgi:hypothetical protein
VLRLARWSLSFRAVQLGLQPSDFVQQPREFFAEFSQPILDSRRNFRELYTLKYSRARKMPETVRQNFCTDAFNVPFERAWPPDSLGYGA